MIRAFRVQPSVAVEAAILMAQAGEFAFVVVALGLSTTLLSAELAQFATAVVAISMMLTPFLAIGGRSIARLAARLEHRADMPPTDASAMTDHVIIGGYGRVGQTIGRLLAAENVPFIALDTNGELVGERQEARRQCLFRRCRSARIPGTCRRSAGARLCRHRQFGARGRTHGGGGAHGSVRMRRYSRGRAIPRMRRG